MADLGKAAYSALMDFPGGKKVSIYQANRLENNIGYRMTFDANGFTLAGATVSVSFDFLTTSNNIASLFSKLFTGDAYNTIGDGESFNTPPDKLTTVTAGTLYKYSTTFATTQNKRYLHVFVWPTVSIFAQQTDYFFRNVEVKVNGVKVNTSQVLFERVHNAVGAAMPVNSLNDYAASVDFLKAAIPFPGKKYLGLTWNAGGDSITAGTGTTIRYWEYLKADLGFANVNNYGIGGSTIAKYDASDSTSAMALRYSSMASNADLTTIWMGTNDAAKGIPVGTMSDRTVDTFYGACHILLSGLTDKFVGKKIAVFTPIIRYSVTQAVMSQYVQAIKEVAAYYSVPCLDLFSMSGIYSYSDTVKTNLVPDGIHLNEAGHRLLADKIGAFLLSI